MVEVEIEVLALEPVAAVDELEGAGIGVNLTAVVGVVLAALVLGLLCCIFQPGEMCKSKTVVVGSVNGYFWF